MSANVIVTIFHGVIILLLISMLFFAVQAFRGRVSWGQARYMGLTAAIFLWIEIIFYLIVFEGAFSIVSFVIDLPFWVDLLVALAVIALMSSIFIAASRRDKFKKGLFITLILIPLGIPGVQVIGKLFKIGSIEIAEKGSIYLAKESYPIEKNFKNDIILLPVFADKGLYAEKLTEKVLKERGYEILDSKASGNTGIDHIAIKFSREGNNKIFLSEAKIIETKADKSRLDDKQMSKIWISDRLENLFLKNKDDKDLGPLYFAVFKEWNKNTGKVKTEIWRHKLDANVLEISKITPGDKAKISSLPEEKLSISKFMKEINCDIKKSCE